VAEKAYPKLVRSGRFPFGCHFVAWQQPRVFAEEMRVIQIASQGCLKLDPLRSCLRAMHWQPIDEGWPSRLFHVV
jgi:hypothetical protein